MHGSNDNSRSLVTVWGNKPLGSAPSKLSTGSLNLYVIDYREPGFCYRATINVQAKLQAKLE